MVSGLPQLQTLPDLVGTSHLCHERAAHTWAIPAKTRCISAGSWIAPESVVALKGDALCLQQPLKLGVGVGHGIEKAMLIR
jgi:hypothetical protein